MNQACRNSDFMKIKSIYIKKYTVRRIYCKRHRKYFNNMKEEIFQDLCRRAPIQKPHKTPTVRTRNETPYVIL